MSTDRLATATRVTYSRQYRRCNKAACPTCVLGSPGHGPYWYAYWREGGRRRSRYIGKHLPPDVAAAQEPVAMPALAVAEEAYAPLRVRTLGGFAVWRGARPLPAEVWSQRKAAMLFKCLLSAPRLRLHREQVAEMLRPEEDSDAAANYLRTTVHRLRKALEDRTGDHGYVRQEGSLLVLVPAPDGEPAEDWLDARAFERAAAAALAGGDAVACRTALALYGGEYLPDDPYDEWAVMRREELRQQYLAVLLRLADLRERDGVLGEAARCLRSALSVDPCNEPAARSLMRLQMAAGRAAEAVRTYKQVAEALQRDLDMRPDSETEEQYQAALASRPAPASPQSNLPTLLTSFLGREQEMAALSLLLAGSATTAAPQCRLLTMTGSGGCGKTRLAIELGHELRSTYPDGLWLVELAALTPEGEADPERLAGQAVDVLGPARRSGTVIAVDADRLSEAAPLVTYPGQLRACDRRQRVVRGDHAARMFRRPDSGHQPGSTWSARRDGMAVAVSWRARTAPARRRLPAGSGTRGRDPPARRTRETGAARFCLDAG